MKKSVYKSGTLLLAALFLLSFALISTGRLQRNFTRSIKQHREQHLISITGMAILLLQTSETDQVVIDVKVTVKYPNRERAEKLLSYIDVEFLEEARTYFSKNSY